MSSTSIISIMSFISIILIISCCGCLQSFQTSFLRPSSNHCRIYQNCLHLTYLHLPSYSLSRQAGRAQGPPFAR